MSRNIPTTREEIEEGFDDIFNSSEYQQELLELMKSKGYDEETQRRKVKYLFSDEFLSDFHKACQLMEKPKPNYFEIIKQLKIINLKFT